MMESLLFSIFRWWLFRCCWLLVFRLLVVLLVSRDVL
jgi:hypothetical protein